MPCTCKILLEPRLQLDVGCPSYIGLYKGNGKENGSYDNRVYIILGLGFRVAASSYKHLLSGFVRGPLSPNWLLGHEKGHDARPARTVVVVAREIRVIFLGMASEKSFLQRFFVSVALWTRSFELVQGWPTIREQARPCPEIASSLLIYLARQTCCDSRAMEECV